MNEQQRHKHRVLNLIRRASLASANPKKRAVLKLLAYQPLACRIRFEGRCDACKNRQSIMVSYQLPDKEWGRRTNSRGVEYESCGFHCSWCGFGNAGARPVNIERERVGNRR